MEHASFPTYSLINKLTFSAFKYNFYTLLTGELSFLGFFFCVCVIHFFSGWSQAEKQEEAMDGKDK